jgi:hypothetical protein
MYILIHTELTYETSVKEVTKLAKFPQARDFGRKINYIIKLCRSPEICMHTVTLLADDTHLMTCMKLHLGARVIARGFWP